MARIIRTVLGDILPEEFGICYPHEHLLGRPPQAYSKPDLVLDNEAAAAVELAWFRAAGGSALVEMSTPDYGRNPEGLQRLSQVSGVHIVAATGLNKEKFGSHPIAEDRRRFGCRLYP